MVSLSNREWYAFFCLCWTLIIFAFVFIIQNIDEIYTVVGRSELKLRTDYVDIAVDQQQTVPQQSVHYDHDTKNELTKPGTIASAQSLSDFIKQLEIAESLKNVAEAVEKIMSLINEFDGIIKIFFDLIPHDSDYEKTLHQFNTVYERFDALTDKMEEIEEKILIAIGWRQYKEERHKVLAVSESFDSMAKNANDPTFQMKFIESCKANRMEDRLEWFAREMNATYTDSMIHNLGSEFHLDFYLSSSADVLTTATKAAFLLGACLRKEQEKEEISDGYINTVEQISNDKIKSIVQSMRNGESTLKNGYFNHLVGEINTKTNEAGEMPNDQFAESLFDYISTKYNWRTWFVASYNGNTRGWDQHAIFETASSSWQRHNNRHVMVATPLDSTKVSDSAAIKEKFLFCLTWSKNFDPSSDDCKVLSQIVDWCLPAPGGIIGLCSSITIRIVRSNKQHCFFQLTVIQ